jgi:hypothetical protein
MGEVDNMDATQQEITAAIVAQTAKATALAVQEAAQAAAGVLAHENSTALTAIAVLQTEVTFLKNQQACFEAAFNRKMDNLDITFKNIFIKLDDMAIGRPPWAVTVILIGMSSLSVGLITYIVTGHPR